MSDCAPHIPAARPRRRLAARGVTLVEVIMALAIASMISAGVAALLFAVANGTKDRQELRRRNVKAEVITNRIDSAIRSSTMVLGRDSRAMVFWVSDFNGNAAPNLSELLRIEWDATTQEIRSYRAPAGLTPAADITYSQETTSFMSVTASLAGSTSFPREVWGRGITAWDSGPNTVTADTRLVHYAMTLEFPGANPAAIRSTVALRGRFGF